MKRLEEQGVVERVVAPDADDATAEEALREAVKLALGPLGTSGIELLPLGWC